MRVLVTGLGTFWGSQLAQRLEARPDVEVIVGVDTTEPRLPLERTEFVRADSSYSILQRIVRATRVDTVLHAHLAVDSTSMGRRALHELNVIGTMNLLAAVSAPGSHVRKMVVKGSTMVYGSSSKDPSFFREDMERIHSPRTGVERSMVEVESFVRDFAEDNPRVDVTTLRFANVLGGDVESPLMRALRMRFTPQVFGFDPRLQFVHETDVVNALLHATIHRVAGIFNVAGDGCLPWSEACAIVGRMRFPLPPYFTQLAADGLRLFGAPLPPEVLTLLKYGRVVDNTAYKRAGFEYAFTTAGAIDAFARGLRLEHAVGTAAPSYRYERDVETFFRHSPAVVRPWGGTAPEGPEPADT